MHWRQGCAHSYCTCRNKYVLMPRAPDGSVLNIWWVLFCTSDLSFTIRCTLSASVTQQAGKRLHLYINTQGHISFATLQTFRYQQLVVLWWLWNAHWLPLITTNTTKYMLRVRSATAQPYSCYQLTWLWYCWNTLHTFIFGFVFALGAWQFSLWPCASNIPGSHKKHVWNYLNVRWLSPKSQLSLTRLAITGQGHDIIDVISAVCTRNSLFAIYTCSWTTRSCHSWRPLSVLYTSTSQTFCALLNAVPQDFTKTQVWRTAILESMTSFWNVSYPWLTALIQAII